MATQQITPVSVFTGFLGSGKTTIILSLISKLQIVKPNYKVVLLKNEFGDAEVDSKLARESNIQVSEMMNGCLCCVLVGQMKNALLDIQSKYQPDRIIVETSGSAFPGPIAWQIRELEPDGFILDSIITVIDCVNFTGYEDTSYTAKLQAKYTDIVLLNKHELVSESAYDTVLDHVYTLNEDPIFIKFSIAEGISPDLVFGIDSKQFKDKDERSELVDPSHHYSEIDLITIDNLSDSVNNGCDDDCGCVSHTQDVDSEYDTQRTKMTQEGLDTFLKTLDKNSVYRVKGIIEIDSKVFILNWAFERYTLTEMTKWEEDESVKDGRVKITVMGVGLSGHVKKFCKGFLVGEKHAKYIKAKSRGSTL
ncbi:hypothetical protein HK098_004477 [Nowakowskiella sp. JEL0407]|nr:hypothetical protein HK098_004477 [Nowakowskiella sp. JEL0407]